MSGGSSPAGHATAWGRLDEQIATEMRRRASTGVPLWQLTPAQARQAATARAHPGATTSPGDSEDIGVTLPGRTLPARLHLPGTTTGPTVVFFHGGGFVTGSVDTHDAQARMLARICDLPVLSVGYRLAPEHRFPAAHEDARDAIRWAASELPRTHGLDGRVAVAGSSAGANLAATASAALAGTPEAPLAQLLAYPLLSADAADLDPDDDRWVGLTPRSVRWYLDHYLRCVGDAADPRFTTLGPSTTWSPPTVISAAGVDPLHRDAIRVAERLEQAGVDVQLLDNPRLPHAFWGMAPVSERARAASELMCDRFAGLARRSAAER